jgi:hypothetical protein
MHVGMYINISFNIADCPDETYKIETKYRFVLDNTGDAIWGKVWIADKDGNVKSKHW